MANKNTPKPLSVFQHLLKSVLLPLVVVVLFLMIILPIFAVLMVQSATEKSANNLFLSIEKKIDYIQYSMNDIASDPTILDYLINGDNKVGVYEKLYAVSNATSLKPYFYLTNSNFTVEALYQPSYSSAADKILNSVNRERLVESAGRMLQLSNSRIKSHFSPALVFAQAIMNDDELVGFIIMNYYSAQVDDLLADVEQTVLVINSLSRIIYSNNNLFTSEERIKLEYQFGNITWYKGNLYLVRTHSFSDINLSIMTLQNINIGTQMIQGVLIAFLFTAGVSTIVFFLFRKKLSKDTFNMLDDMFASLENYRNSGKLVPVAVSENSMTDYIMQYNALIEDIEELITKNKELTNDTTIAQLKQLQSQFDPHFLFNTLASIQTMIEVDQSGAVDMIRKLAAMLRYSLKQSEGNKVLLKDDMEYIKDYLALQKVRFQEFLTYDIDIEDDNFLVPKLILQPIIENSIQHGFTGDRLFKIFIKIYHIDDDLIMLVKDNGRGFRKSRLKEIQAALTHANDQSKHIGLFNCNRRLKLFYGPQYGLSIDSILNKGTTVMLRCKAERK